MEVRGDALERYNVNLQEQLEGTVWNTGCASWYVDEHGRNVTLWPDWTFRFRQQTAKFDAELLRADPAPAPASPRGGGRVSKRVMITGAASGIGGAAAEQMRSRARASSAWT